MKLKVVVPTYKREKKLARCLSSIMQESFLDLEVIVFVDNKDKHTYDFLRAYRDIIEMANKDPKLKIILNNKQLFVGGSWNKFFRLTSKVEFHSIVISQIEWDCALMLVDDVELMPHCIGYAIKCFKENFPDGDGIVGITQMVPGHPEANKWNEGGQILIGRKFVERFKEVDYQVFCSDYSHWFIDEELELYAKSIGKFVLCKDAILKHYHPSRIKEEIDETHRITRRDIYKRDMDTYRRRQGKNLTWGQSWERVNE